MGRTENEAARTEIMTLLKKEKDGIYASEIAEKLSLDILLVMKVLNELAKDDKIAKIG